METLDLDRRRRPRGLMNLGLVISQLVQVQVDCALGEEGYFLVD
jgi:hypothetical protein